MEKKQSSIEWLENQLKERYSLMNSEPLFEKAKAMHKEEIKNAQMDMFLHFNNLPYSSDYLNKMQDTNNGCGEYYYNETFGGEK